MPGLVFKPPASHCTAGYHLHPPGHGHHCLRAETSRLSIALFSLSWEHAYRATQMFHSSVHVCKWLQNLLSFDFEVPNKFQGVEEFSNMKLWIMRIDCIHTYSLYTMYIHTSIFELLLKTFYGVIFFFLFFCGIYF